MSQLKILLCVNNYSYFQRDPVTGPKSLLALINILEHHECKILLLTKKIEKLGTFPTKNMDIYELTSINLINKMPKCDIIICDRSNIIKSLIIAKVFKKRICLRLLGMAGRLQSRRVLSYRKLCIFVTRLMPLDLIISTLDGSTSEGPNFIKSQKFRHRINGVEKFLKSNTDIDSKLFFFVGRDSEEKGVDVVIQYFKYKMSGDRTLLLFGPSGNSTSYKDDSGSTVNIIFKGFIKREDIISQIQPAIAMISCNHHGCLGNSELEAIQMGKQILYLGPKEKLNYIPKSLKKYFITDISALRCNTLSINTVPDFGTVHLCDGKEIINLIK